MNIYVVDDDPAILRVAADLLTRMGHRVYTFADPAEALSALTAQVDLFITDVDMPAMDGFAVATRVAAVLGHRPPRTLLISGEDHFARLRSSLPDTVIGLLRKPPSIAHLNRVVDYLARTRHRCPGLEIAEFRDSHPPSAECLAFGECDHYADCPEYNIKCGRLLQEWISRGG